MKRALLLSIILCTSGCWTFDVKAPSRSASNVLANQVGTLQSDVNDRASGNNAAIERASQDLPESRAKDVIGMFVGDQYTLLGYTKAETKAKFVQAAEALLSQDASKRASGESLRQTLSGENAKLKQDLATKQADFDKQRAQEEADHKAQLDKVRLEAEQAQRRLVSLIFFGAALLGLLLAAVVFTTAQYVPMFGPKVAFGCLGFSAVSAGTGVGVLQLMNHPEVVWCGIGIISLIGVATAALMYANHQHHVSDATK